MFKEGYHIAHCQSTGNIFRYNPVQKPKIRFHLSTKETGFGMLSPDCLCGFIPRRSW
jgi:hypothetical protein